MYKCTISPSSTADYSRLTTLPQNRYVFRGVSPFRWNSSGLRPCVHCWRTEWEELVGASLAWDAGFQLSCLVTLLCRFRMIPEGSHDGKTIALYHVGLVGRSLHLRMFLGPLRHAPLLPSRNRSLDARSQGLNQTGIADVSWLFSKHHLFNLFQTYI